MALNDSKVVLFNDGEGLTHGDLNDVVKGATQRAWEWPGYGNAIPHAIITSATYETVFAGGTDLATTVFCHGGGACIFFTGLTLQVGAGFLGTYEATAPPSVLDPKMRWVKADSTQNIVLTAAPSGQKRYDVLTLAIAESASDTDSRDFKDATTGALSTTTPNKRTKLAGTLSVTSGTAGASPSPPAVPAAHVVAVALVNDTDIEAIYDCTVPFGQGFTSLSIPSRDFINGASFADNGVGGIIASGTAHATILPADCAGDPSARLLGFEIKYSLTTGFAAQLVRLEPGSGSPPVLATLTSSLTAGAGPNTTKIDLRGYGPSAVVTTGPFWGSGDTVKRGQLYNSGKTVALYISGASTNDLIHWVKWFWAKS